MAINKLQMEILAFLINSAMAIKQSNLSATDLFCSRNYNKGISEKI